MFEVVDYSRVYFELFEEVSIPRQRGGKFVVLTNGDDTYAVFAPQRFCSLHSQIVKRFLELRKVPTGFDATWRICVPRSEDWLVQGGGKWVVDEDAGRLELYGTSYGYGPVDLERVASGIRKADGFDGLDIVVK